MSGTIVVIGAGPKALALHARAQVLNELGRPSPNVVVIERSSVGANWRGEGGFTDGNPPLVTPPECDIGFPYASGDSDVDVAMSRFSWHTFKIATGSLLGWLVGGRKMPTHGDFAEYLRWLETRSALATVPGDVVPNGIRRDGDQWIIRYRQPGTQDEAETRGDSVVMTGPGEPKRLIEGHVAHPNISDGETFWYRIRGRSFQRLHEGAVAVIGNGDTAASVLWSLLDVLPSKVKIDVYCNKGLLIPRDARLVNLRYSTDPAFWAMVPAHAKEGYIQRTQRGVCSEVFLSRIDQAKNVEIRGGLVTRARMRGRRVEISIDGQGVKQYKRVVVATGFDRCAFIKLFKDPSVFPKRPQMREWERGLEERTAKKIGDDLRYRPGFERPKLFVPGLAGMACAPGFADLGALGSMARIVIDTHLAGMR